jgi:hypothetical protein
VAAAVVLVQVFYFKHFRMSFFALWRAAGFLGALRWHPRYAFVLQALPRTGATLANQ